jgi:hypothetical protein
VHVDEKWFYMTVDGECYLLAPDEDPPVRRCRSKRYISKVMFLCAQARPRWINGKYWDGKIGIWPIGHVGETERASQYRPAGYPVWVNESVTREKYRQVMIEDVLPAIVVKFPSTYMEFGRGRQVVVQQDGAKSHIKDDDPEWLEAVETLGVNIQLETQPANSPDTNINDLGFFRAIQKLYSIAAPKDEFDLIKAVEDA